MQAKRYSLIANNYPTYMDKPLKNADGWLECKRNDDNAEGLWRIHDTLYDLTDFINSHPGGPEWLQMTKGTDITEAFLVHHVVNVDKVESILAKFRVREAKKPRNIKLTFKEDGFYRTLKRRVVEKLPTISRKSELTSKLYIDGLLLGTFLTAIFGTRYQLFPLILLSGVLFCWTVISAHNYFHRRNNFRMLYFNISFMSYREWRVSHALSHHLYPNSLQDMELLWLEPFLVWVPDGKLKNFVQRYVSWIYGPIMWALFFALEPIKRAVPMIMEKKNLFYKEDAIPLALPLAMYLLGNSDVLQVVKLWAVIILLSSFVFATIGLNAGHHHPDVLHDGDALRKDLDWGIFTIDTIIDRQDLKKSHFLTITHFGHHALHHLFPTLDHGILNDLNDILLQTLAEFEVELRSYSWYPLIIGQHLQLARTEPMTKCGFERSIYGKNK